MNKGDYPSDMAEDEEDEDVLGLDSDSDSDEEEEIRETVRPTIGLDPDASDLPKRRFPRPRRQRTARGSIVTFTESVYESVVSRSRNVVRKRFQSNTAAGLVSGIRNRFFSVPDSSSHHESSEDVQEDVESLQDEMVSLWQKNIYDTITLSDLPRLIDRVTLLDGKGKALLDPEDHEFGTRFQTAEYISKVAQTILHELEEPDDAQRISAEIDDLLASLDEDTDSDLVGYSKKLVEIVGEESKVAKIFQCFNQAVIAKCFFILRKMVLYKHLTKDVRERRGWQIKVTLANFVQVRHCRWEQSLEKGDNHWEFEWQISLTFNRKMDDISSSRLLIKQLELSETMDPDLADEISEMLHHGDLIVQ
mmetsp:Transcript_10354/g.11889  ORF Transcript_10354/g.11889 Transcript_10354/m.11889 type:complete len:363 (-) Transcript_10354:168-1256(-)